MKRSIRAAVFLLVVVISIGAAGCNVKPKHVGKSQSALPNITLTPSGITTTPQASTTPQSPSIVSTPGGVIRVKTKVPAIVRAFENNLLMTIKYVNSTKWKSVDTRVASMRKELPLMLPVLEQEGIAASVRGGISSSMDALEGNVKGKKAMAAKLNANELLRYAADVRGSYASSFPLDLMRMNYYFRDIQYTAEDHKFSEAANDLGFLTSFWKSTAASMSARDKNIAKMDNEIKKLRQYVSDQNIKKIVLSTENGLRISSSIQKMFEKKGKRI